MKLIKKSIALVATTLLFASAYSQSFEGMIEFRKMTDSDTMTYVYYIKGDKVRVDEIGASYEKQEGSYIIDLKALTVIAVSNERKMYFDQPPSKTPAILKCKPEPVKTANKKTIHGYECIEYTVKCTEENTMVTYWLASGKFDFFERMLKLLNRKDKSAIYFQKITGVAGMFPFVSVEATIAGGQEKVRMEVIKIEKKKIDNAKFEIPAGFKKGEN